MLHMLVLHQDRMELNAKVNTLLGLSPMNFDDFQNTICGVRSFVYSTRPRKDPSGFVEDMRSAHKKWHIKVGMPLCWREVVCKVSETEGTSKKRPRA